MGQNYNKTLNMRIGRQHREKQRATCRRKVRFPSHDACAKFCGRRSYAYQCPVCKFWHRTHKKKPVFSEHRQEEMAARVLESFR